MSKINRESFVFYRSIFEAIEQLENDATKAETYRAICKYALMGIEPNNLSPTANIIFTMAKPTIDKNQRLYENARKGGAPKGNKNAAKNRTPEPGADDGGEVVEDAVEVVEDAVEVEAAEILENPPWENTGILNELATDEQYLKECIEATELNRNALAQMANKFELEVKAKRQNSDNYRAYFINWVKKNYCKKPSRRSTSGVSEEWLQEKINSVLGAQK